MTVHALCGETWIRRLFTTCCELRLDLGVIGLDYGSFDVSFYPWIRYSQGLVDIHHTALCEPIIRLAGVVLCL
jgi:hypothetical protein